MLSLILLTKIASLTISSALGPNFQHPNPTDGILSPVLDNVNDKGWLLLSDDDEYEIAPPAFIDERIGDDIARDEVEYRVRNRINRSGSVG